MIAKPDDSIVYPDSDGQPMADNTLQESWIAAVKANLDRLFADAPDVFVAADHLIYPVKGDPTVRIAPDVYVAFGRPKGHRGSYKVWQEGGVFPQVVWEILSPGNTGKEMDGKRDAYEEYGAEEYVVIDPDRNLAEAYLRDDAGNLAPVTADGFIRPRTGVRLAREAGEWVAYLPAGRAFESAIDIGRRAAAAEERIEELEQERDTERAQREAAERAAAAERAQREAAERERDAERAQREADAGELGRFRALLKSAGLDPGAGS